VSKCSQWWVAGARVLSPSPPPHTVVIDTYNPSYEQVLIDMGCVMPFGVALSAFFHLLVVLYLILVKCHCCSCYPLWLLSVVVVVCQCDVAWLQEPLCAYLMGISPLECSSAITITCL
jgi:hypothetical protein